MKRQKRSGAAGSAAQLLDTSTLIAQAVAEGLPLVTDDERIEAYPVQTIW